MTLISATNIKLNKLFKNFSAKYIIIKKLKKQFNLLKNLDKISYESIIQIVPNNVIKNLINLLDHTVWYIIDISFSRSNTFLHVMNSDGGLEYYSSAGPLKYRGKRKTSRLNVFKSMYRILIKQRGFLEKKPIALHLKNIGGTVKRKIVKKLEKKFFIKTVKMFNLFPFNGCRNKKIRRKKIRKKKEGMAEWFKAADCKSVEFSHQRFESFFLHSTFT